MKKFSFVILFSIVMGITVNAQMIKPLDLKNARNAVYEWVSDYNIYCRCEGRNAKDNFISLFKDGNVLIFNDYLPNNLSNEDCPQISINDYADLLMNDGIHYKMQYEIVGAEIVSEDCAGNKINYIIKFTKKLWFEQKDSYEDGRHEHPYNEKYTKFKIKVDLNYDISQKRIYATSLKNVDKFEPYIILHNDGKNIYYTDDELENLCREKSNHLIKYKSVGILEDQKMKEFKIDTIENYIGFGFAYGFSSFSPEIKDSRFLDYYFKANNNVSFWVDYYRQLWLKGKSRFGLELDLMLRKYSSEIELNFEESYTAIDPDGGQYERLITISNYNEKLLHTALEMPINLKYDYLLNDNISLFVKGGIVVSYDIQQYSKATADAFYRGYYDWLFNVTLSQNGIYDFGTFALNESGNGFGVNKFACGGILGIGASYFIFDKWSMDIGLQYRKTFFRKVKDMEDYHLSNRDRDWTSVTYRQESYLDGVFNLFIQINYNF